MVSRANEGQTQVVFGRIDPLLQALLPLVSQYQQYVERNNNDSAFLIQLIQSQVKVLENLQQIIQRFGPPFAHTMIVLADYISLPLNAIFHVPALLSITNAKDDENLRRSQIQTSYVRSLHRETAKTVQFYVQTCCSQEENDRALPVRLKDSHLLKFLVALTNALPSPSSLLDDSSNALDEGTETWLALLDAVKAIVSVCSADEIYSQWDGNLIVRLADCTTSMALSKNLKLSLESLEILECLLLKVRRAHLWQSIFPGIFASLHRRFITINRQTSSGLSIAIETKCLLLIKELLVVTLEQWKKKESHKGRRSALEMLQELAIESPDMSAETAEVETEQSSFLQELKTRVVIPLSFLLRQSAISSSTKVRIQLAEVCQVLSVETAGCWTSTTIPELAFNTCLILQSDPQDIVANFARKTVRDIRHTQPGSTDHSWMIARIQALVEEAKTLAQGAKQIEMQTQLQLLVGYIEAVGSTGSAALAASTGMHKSLIVLTDINLDSAIFKGQALGHDERKESQLQFQILTGDNVLLARKMLRVLGAALGSKHGAIVVDRLISDFYEHGLEQLSKFGDFQEAFFHQWIGSVVVSQEILKGSFSENSGSNAKQMIRRRRILESLASSILPLLVDSSLWNIRTLEGLQEGGFPVTASDSSLAAKGLLCNTCVMTSLLEFTSSFFRLLGTSVTTLVPVLLFPIIEKASTHNAVPVQIAAEESATVLAKESNFSCLQDLIRHNFSPLMAAMFGRLRLPGGMPAPAERDLRDILALVASTTWVLKIVTTTDAGQSCGEGKADTISLIDLISLLEDRFDHLSLRKLLSEDNIHNFLLVHQLCFDFLNTTVGANGRSLYSYPSERRMPESAPWLDLLSNFHKPGLSGLEEHATKERKDTREKEKAELLVGIGEIEFVSRLITKDCYLLSNKSLMAQVSACGSLTSGYRLLAFVSCNYEDSEDEQSIIKNSILRQAATSWPSIKARLHNAMDGVIGAETMSISLIVLATNVTSGSSQDIASKRFFLANLFTLVATMCECGGEFMANRFKQDVWPVIARFLERILQRSIRKENKRILVVGMQKRADGIEQPSVSDLKDSEQHLVKAILDCLGRVIRILDLPERTLTAAASTLLPFLDSNYYGIEIGERSVETLKKLADKNCDVLCRPLLHLSGRGIPSFRLGSKKDTQTPAPISTHTESSELELKANDLLSYIDALPEQRLE